MRKVFLLVMMGLLVVLFVSCKDKKEEILAKVHMDFPSELTHKNDLIQSYCMDMSSISSNETENNEECVKIRSAIETEYYKKFLSLLDNYMKEKVSIEKIQESFNEIGEEKLKEEILKIDNLISSMNFDNINKSLSIRSLFVIDYYEEPGIYHDRIIEIEDNDNSEWEKNTSQELQIRARVIMKKGEIPMFSDSKFQKFAEKYLKYRETSEVYVIYREKDKFIDHLEKDGMEIYSDLENLMLNASNEDKKKLTDYIEKRNNELDELIDRTI